MGPRLVIVVGSLEEPTTPPAPTEPAYPDGYPDGYEEGYEEGYEDGYGGEGYDNSADEATTLPGSDRISGQCKANPSPHPRHSHYL